MSVLGKLANLPILEVTPTGYWLDAGDVGRAWLAQREVGQELAVGERVAVVTFHDGNNNLVATTQTPLAYVDEFVQLKVASVTSIGAFLDWGLPKDLLVPNSLQQKPMLEGRSYLVHLMIDERDNRIVATSKIDRHLEDFLGDDNKWLKQGSRVSLVIANRTDLGFKAIVDNRYWGTLYYAETAQALQYGQRITGYIKGIREDGKLDLSLSYGSAAREDHAALVLQHLDSADGFLPLHDKSAPELILSTLGISKSAFKKAIGGLYKRKLIAIEADGIRRLEE